MFVYITIFSLKILDQKHFAFILTRMLVSVSKSHRKRLENYGKDIKT